MAAYAALVSLMTTINNIQIHPRISTFFYHQQIQSLDEIIDFLLDFIESSSAHGGSREEEKEVLERRIASTVHAVEDVIESHVVDQILADAPQKTKFEASNLIFLLVTFCARLTRYITGSFFDLEKEIDLMNSVKETVMVFRGTIKIQDEQPSHSTLPAASKPTTKKNLMVGFDEKKIPIMDRLTGDYPDLQIVPIVGMGGIGKTTLAKNVYESLLIVESFDIHAWVTISQEYTVKYVLSELLSCISIGAVDYGPELETEDHNLGQKLYQTLWGRRYLIVLDDVWTVEAWDKIKFFLPSNGQRSRVVITTRIARVATHLSSTSFEMSFLDEDQSWELFCKNVFLEKGCPPELEEIGKEIARKCKGLPLSIVVIGGLLRNSRSTCEYWEKFESDLNSILMSGNDELCFKILFLSYNHLPAHLKPCFLYMGVFREDEKIRVSRLIKLFVDEGFLKPKEGQTMEEVAEDYINDLVDRNLILAESWKWNGRVKSFKMHDVVREVCLKIGERHKIFNRMKMFDIELDVCLKKGEAEELCHRMKMFGIPADINSLHRIVFNDIISWTYNWSKKIHGLPSPSASLARTFLLSDWDPLPFKFRLVRVLSSVVLESHEDICQHVNLRYLHWRLQENALCWDLPSSIYLLWNVHTLIYDGRNASVEAPSEIWYMIQLRHLQFEKILLPNLPPWDKVKRQDGALLPNLHTLSTVVNFSFTEEVCKRIPNIKKLGIAYDGSYGEECQEKFCYYLQHLRKLESLYCSRLVMESVQSLVFPNSLRKLSLENCGFHWEDINTFGLSLPHLQVLKLHNTYMGPEWDCVEGAFPCLKFLQIEWGDLIKWSAESSDLFPVLEKLHLKYLWKLEKIPSGMGEIQTLRSLHLHCCSVSTAFSSLEILEEQLSLGNDDLKLEVGIHYDLDEEESFREKVEMNNLAGKNFKYEILYDFMT